LLLFGFLDHSLEKFNKKEVGGRKLANHKNC
jgi:hypothetical protein